MHTELMHPAALLSLAASGAGAGPVNLLSNPGFEQGAERWSPVNAEVVADGTRSGRQCARIRLPNALGIDFRERKFYLISDSFEATADADYTLTVWPRHRAHRLPVEQRRRDQVRTAARHRQELGASG